MEMVEKIQLNLPGEWRKNVTNKIRVVIWVDRWSRRHHRNHSKTYECDTKETKKASHKNFSYFYHHYTINVFIHRLSKIMLSDFCWPCLGLFLSTLNKISCIPCVFLWVPRCLHKMISVSSICTNLPLGYKNTVWLRLRTEKRYWYVKS
jgi:hypothetical protein